MYFIKILSGSRNFWYRGVFPGFVYGRCFALLRSSVTARKLTVVLLASTVISESLSRKVLHRSFLILSISSGVRSRAANQSSRYRPMLWPYFLERRDSK